MGESTFALVVGALILAGMPVLLLITWICEKIATLYNPQGRFVSGRKFHPIKNIREYLYARRVNRGRRREVYYDICTGKYKTRARGLGNERNNY